MSLLGLKILQAISFEINELNSVWPQFPLVFEGKQEKKQKKKQLNIINRATKREVFGNKNFNEIQ